MELMSSWALSNRTADWKEEGLCRGKTELFFSINGYNQANIANAKVICQKCPVKGKCLKYAQDNMLAYGIWGGKTSTERRALLGLKRWPTQ